MAAEESMSGDTPERGLFQRFAEVNGVDRRQVFDVSGAKIRLAKSAQFDILERNISSDLFLIEKTWLFSILKHKIIDHFRKNESNGFGKEILHDTDRVETLFNSKGDWQIRPQHWHNDPGKNQEIKEFLDHFYECLAGLPRRNAVAFVHREIDGLSTEEICKLLDISATNCWGMIYRARMSLRRCLELAGFIPPNERTSK